MNKYYSIRRPIGPGTCPQPAGNRILEITNFDRREFVQEIGRPAWGYLVYECPLEENDVYNYDLMKGESEND